MPRVRRSGFRLRELRSRRFLLYLRLFLSDAAIFGSDYRNRGFFVAGSGDCSTGSGRFTTSAAASATSSAAAHRKFSSRPTITHRCFAIRVELSLTPISLAFAFTFRPGAGFLEVAGAFARLGCLARAAGLNPPVESAYDIRDMPERRYLALVNLSGTLVLLP